MEDKNFVFGLHSAIEAIHAGKEIDRILIRKGLQGELYMELMKLVRQFEIPFQYVSIDGVRYSNRYISIVITKDTKITAYYSLDNR